MSIECYKTILEQLTQTRDKEWDVGLGMEGKSAIMSLAVGISPHYHFTPHRGS